MRLSKALAISSSRPDSGASEVKLSFNNNMMNEKFSGRATKVIHELRENSGAIGNSLPLQIHNLSDKQMAIKWAETR